MLKKLFAVSLLLLITKSAIAIDHAQYFPAVAQGHSCTKAGGDNEQFKMEGKGVEINGTKNQPLDFCGIKHNSRHTKSCDGKTCTITGDKNTTPALNWGNIGYDFDSNFKEGSEFALEAYKSLTDIPNPLPSGDYLLGEQDIKNKVIDINTNGKVRLFFEDDVELKSSIININGDVDIYIKGDFELEDSSNLTTTGNVVFYVSGEFELKESSNLTTIGNVKFFVNDQVEIEKSKVNVDGSLELYSKGETEFKEAKVKKLSPDSEVYIYGFDDVEVKKASEIDGYIYAGKKLEMEDNDESNVSIINGRVTAEKLRMNKYSIINGTFQGAGEEPVVRQCFTDDFNRSSLGSDWITSKSSGTFTPSIVGDRFRLTEAKQSQATAVSYNKIFAASNNHIVIEFDHFAYVPKSANDTEQHGADGIAVVFSDADLKAYPGSAGGPLGYGYKSSSPGFTGGWLGIGIDEHGNFATQGGDTNKSNRVRDTITVRGSGQDFSGYNFLNRYTSLNGEKYYGESKRNKYNCGIFKSCYVSDPRAHRYRIILDTRTKGTAFVSVERNVEPNIESSKFETIFTSFDILKSNNQAPLPKNILLSITGSTGSLINVHEVDNIEVCADRFEELNAKIDHFRFSVENINPQACGEEPIVLKACANADCSEEYTGQARVVLNSSGDMQWQGGNVVEFTGSTALKLASTGQVALDVISSTPRAVQFKDTLCQIGNSAYSKINCQLNFSNKDKIIKLTLPSAYAGQTVEGELLPQEKCKALYANQEKQISFSTELLKPDKPAATPGVVIKYQNKALIDNKTTVKFDKEGKAKFNFTYPEAGVVAITAKESNLTGTANLVTIPKCLQVTTNADCTDGNASCPPFAAAGEEFALTINAYGSDEDGNTCVLNNSLENYQQQVKLSHKLVAPIDGEEGELELIAANDDATMIEDNVYVHQPIKQGNNKTKQTLSEVGVFTMTAEPKGAYEGSSLTTEAGTSAPIGRFYPARFVLNGFGVKAIHDGDPKESYMEQPFEVDLEITAMNVQGDATENYQGKFAKSEIKLQVVSDEKDNQSKRISPWPEFGSWKEGVIDFNSESIIFSRQAEPDGPYELNFKLSSEEKDNENKNILFEDKRGSSSATYQCSEEENCVANPLILGKQNVRYGRVFADSVSGSPSESLSAPLRIEYWDTAQDKFIDFEEDDWSEFTLSSPSGAQSEVSYTQLSVVDAGLTTTVDGELKTEVTAKEGKVYLTVKPPGAPITVDYKVEPPAWLTYPENQSGWLKFGVSKGNSSIIYRKESFERKFAN